MISTKLGNKNKNLSPFWFKAAVVKLGYYLRLKDVKGSNKADVTNLMPKGTKWFQGKFNCVLNWEKRFLYVLFFFFFFALAQYILKVFNQRLIIVCIGCAYEGGSKNYFQSAGSRTQTGEHIQLSSLQIPWNREPNQLSQPPWLDSYIFYFSFENPFMYHMELKSEKSEA